MESAGNHVMWPATQKNFFRSLTCYTCSYTDILIFCPIVNVIFRIILRFCETAHLPLPEAKILP